MADLHIVNTAVFDALAQVPSVHYVIVTWESDRCVVSSNERDEEMVLARLLAAAKLLSNADLAMVDENEVMGHA